MNKGQIETILADISERLSWYTIGIVKESSTTKKSDISLLGSGTLIEFNNVFAILTAQHLTKELNNVEQFGIILDKNEHRFFLNRQHVSFIEFSSSQKSAKGPDLALIKLHGNIVEIFKAKKSFYSLSLFKDCGVLNHLCYQEGLWNLSGFIEGLTKQSDSIYAFDSTKAFCLLNGPTIINEYYEEDNFDYCRAVVNYEENINIPQSFGGMSGGGLWKIILKITKDSVPKIDKAILCGVPFYETGMENNQRKIICHAHKSIYDNICLSLKDNKVF